MSTEIVESSPCWCWPIADEAHLERVALRKRMRQFLHDAATDPAWQAAFVAMQEMITDPETPDEHRGQGNMPRSTSVVAEHTSQTQSETDIPEHNTDDMRDHTEPPKTHAAPIMMADDTNPVLCAAVAWPSGMKQPTDGFLRRVAES